MIDFVSILSVYEDGAIVALLTNIKIKKDKIISLLDKKSDSTPVAGNLEREK